MMSPGAMPVNCAASRIVDLILDRYGVMAKAAP
jgi:hypothetical protein